MESLSEISMPTAAVFIDGPWLYYALKRLKFNQELNFQKIFEVFEEYFGNQTPIYYFFIENGIIEISPEHNEERFYNDKIGLNTYEGIFDWTPDEKSPARITFNATGYVMLDGALDQWPCFTWTYTILQ
jgi:hypothetical protein